MVVFSCKSVGPAFSSGNPSVNNVTLICTWAVYPIYTGEAFIGAPNRASRVDATDARLGEWPALLSFRWLHSIL